MTKRSVADRNLEKKFYGMFKKDQRDLKEQIEEALFDYVRGNSKDEVLYALKQFQTIVAESIKQERRDINRADVFG